MSQLSANSFLWIYSAPTEIGMSRLSLSTADKQVRDWFDKTVKQLGCSVIVDSMGNQFAIRPGSQDGPPTFAGSHLDTQPSVSRCRTTPAYQFSMADL